MNVILHLFLLLLSRYYFPHLAPRIVQIESAVCMISVAVGCRCTTTIAKRRCILSLRQIVCAAVNGGNYDGCAVFMMGRFLLLPVGKGDVWHFEGVI